MQIDLQSYSDNEVACGMLASFFKKTGDQKWELDKSRPPPTIVLVAEPGALVDIVGADNIHRIGLLQEQLLRTRVSLDSANATEARVLGFSSPRYQGGRW